MVDQSAGAERIESLRKEAFEFSSSDRIGVIMARAFELLSVLTKSGINRQIIRNAIDSLELERSFSLAKDNRKDEPTRHLIYGLCESLTIAISSMSGKDAIQGVQESIEGICAIKQELSDEDSYDVTDSGTQEMGGIAELQQGVFADQSPIGVFERPRPEDVCAFVADQEILADVVETLQVPKEEEEADEMDQLFRATTSAEHEREKAEEETPASSHYDFGMDDCWSDDDDKPLLPSTSAADGDQFVCRLCKKVFDRTGALRSHIHSKHNKAAPIKKSINIKRKACRYCNKPCWSERERRDHVCRPEDVKTYHCMVCDHRFPTRYASIVHMMNIHRRKEFMCNKCGADFQFRRDLSEHEKTHVTAEALVTSYISADNP